MASAQEYCERCKQYGHTQNRCPRRNRQRQRQQHQQHEQHQQQFYPVMGMHPGMMMGMHQGVHPGMMMGMHQGMYPGMMMGMHPGMYHHEQHDEAQDFRVESHYAVPVALDENFWYGMGIEDINQVIENVYQEYRNFMFGNMMQGGLVDKLPLTTELCKKQNLENPQSNFDMGLCFIAVGIISRILHHKCRVMLKGKTGLYLCADVLKVAGDLENQTTDDIDLVILAKHDSEDDFTRRVFAQQVGAFITVCLEYKREMSIQSAFSKAVAEGNQRLTYSCVDVVLRGPGICGKHLESKNVKVSLGDTAAPRKKIKLVDITYSTYDPMIDKLYSRVRRHNIGGVLSFFYLHVDVALMEYVYIIYKNVRQCREFVASGAAVERLPLQEHPEEEPRAHCDSAACFLSRLTDFEQKTMFKFSKSAFLCASVIADLPEYETAGLPADRLEHIRKRIVLMQLRKLSRYGVISKVFSSTLSQAYDVLSEMLDDVILQQRSRDEFGGVEMHKHLAGRLRASELPAKERMTTRFLRPIERFDSRSVPAFQLQQMIPEVLVSPGSPGTSDSLTSRGHLSGSENERTKRWRKKHKGYKHLTIKQKRARQNFLKNRRRIFGPDEGVQGVAAEASDVSPLFKDMTSSDSGVLGFRTPMSNISPRSESSGDGDGDGEQQHDGGAKMRHKRKRNNTRNRNNRKTKRSTKRNTKRSTKK